MKKFLIGLLMGAVLFVPATALAEYLIPRPNIIYGFNCSKGSDVLSDCQNAVAVFDDRDNKCYISYDRLGAQSSISCVKH